MEGLAKAPFRTVATILLGAEHVQPCPVCRRDGTHLDVLDRVGKCYGRCGNVTLARLFDTIFKPVEPAPSQGPVAPPSDRVAEQASDRRDDPAGREPDDRAGAAGASRPRRRSHIRRGNSIMASQASPGQMLASMLFDSLHAYQIGPVVGDHARQIIWGVTPDGSFVDGMTLDGFLAQAGQILRDSGRLYKFGNTIVYETDAPGDQRLTTLAVQHRAEPNAAPILANLFGVGYETKQGVVQSLAASKLIGAVLADESLWRQLPEIRYYARRPTFDLDFNLCKPGWNAASGILVHAPEVVPTFHAPASAPDARALDRLPPRLRGLFAEFSWRSDADLVNALAMLLTGLLINHFVDDPHPGGIVDANQPGTGKTLYVQVIGRILDGAEPPRTSLVRDEELEKRLCAQLRSYADLAERARWDDYMAAFEDVFEHTSTEWAPWYIIPADRKWFTHIAVANIINHKLGELDLAYPTIDEEQREQLRKAKAILEAEE